MGFHPVGCQRARHQASYEHDLDVAEPEGLGPVVVAKESVYRYVYPALLFHLSDRRSLGRLTSLDATAGEIPHVKILAQAQQDPPCPVQHDRPGPHATTL